MSWNIIWQVAPDDPSTCIERDWLYDMLSLVPIGEIRIDAAPAPRLGLALPSPIICASCPNQTGKLSLNRYLKALPRPRVLYHMSDEYVEIGRDTYRHCDLVIRNGSPNPATLGDANVLQLPLGYVSGLGNGAGTFALSSRRKCPYAFLGTIKHDRAATMLPALQRLPGAGFVRKTASFAAATRFFGNLTVAVYRNAVFVPCPKGNWNPESNRLYDALEWGCIPLIRRYRDSPYHDTFFATLLGEHPLPIFDSWDEAAGFAGRLLGDAGALDALQARIHAWWQAHKASLRAAIAARLSALAAA